MGILKQVVYNTDLHMGIYSVTYEVKITNEIVWG